MSRWAYFASMSGTKEKVSKTTTSTDCHRRQELQPSERVRRLAGGRRRDRQEGEEVERDDFKNSENGRTSKKGT